MKDPEEGVAMLLWSLQWISVEWWPLGEDSKWETGLLSCWLKATLSDVLSKVFQIFKKSPSRQNHHWGCTSLIPVKNYPPIISVSAWWLALARGTSPVTSLDKRHLLHVPLTWVEKPFNTRKWKKLNTSSHNISLGTNWLFASQYSRHYGNRSDRKSDTTYFHSSKI